MWFDLNNCQKTNNKLFQTERFFLYLVVMVHHVYIIYSVSLDIYYKGYSLNPERRVLQHNNNESRYTKNKGPWILIYKQSYKNKKDALIRERVIKKYSKKQILQLLDSTKNEI